MPIIVQIDAYDPVTAGPVTLRMASDDDTAVCHLNGQVWWPVLDRLPVLAMDFFGGEFGQVTTAAASLSLAVEPWPDFARYAFPDARLQIWHGDAGAAWAGYTLRFDGRVTSQPVIEDGRAQIGFAVDDKWLDTPMLATYAGTGGVEGPAAMKGTVKPLAIGAPMGVPGVMLDPIKSILQLSAYGAIESVDVPLERLARQFGSPIADYATYAALDAAAVPAGQWATAKAVGLVKMGAPPYGKLCFLMKGDKGGVDGWVRRPGAIIKRYAGLSGGAAKVSEAAVDALDAARPYDLSVYYDGQVTAREAIQEIAASVNAVAGVSLTGQLIVVPIQINATGLTLRADGSSLPIVGSVRALGISAPWWRLAIGAQPFFDVHGQGEYATDTTPETGATVGAVIGDNLRKFDDSVPVQSLIITPEGTAAAIAGQGALATANQAAYGSQISGLPAPITPANLLASGSRLSAAFMQYTGGPTIESLQPSQAGADVTSTKTAAAIAGQGPGATAVAGDVLNYTEATGITVIARPVGAQIASNAASAVGALKIALPVGTFTNAMLRFRVDIYDYSGDKSCTYLLAGYPYAGTGSGGAWINCTAQFIGRERDSKPVYFGHDGTKLCVWIGSPASTWSYVTAQVYDFQARQGSGASTYKAGWAITLDTVAATNTTPGNGSITSILKPRAADAVFGENVFEATAGVTATLPNFKTPLGTAAAIAGQGALATKSQAAWGVDLSGIPEDRIYANLLNTSQWVVGTSGSQGSFSQTGITAESSVILASGPFGSTEPIWRAISDPSIPVGGGHDGGWNCNFTYNNFSSKRTLRFIGFARRNVANGDVYFGCSGGGQTLNLAGTVNSNPYFWAGQLPQLNKWYMLVGILHGSDYAGSDTGISGVYDVATGQKVVSGIDFKMAASATLQVHRLFHFGTTATVTTDFARPRVEILEASSPTLDSLMNPWSRIGTNLLRASGNVLATEAVLVTSLGTASGITGQSDWATYTGINTTNMAGRVSALDTSGNLSAIDKITNRRLTLLRRADNVTAVSEPDLVTILGVASAITGQAPTATSSDFSVLTGTTKPQNNATNDRFLDTRNTNQPPSWYLSNYNVRSAYEFKDSFAIGVPGSISGAGWFGALTTQNDYLDFSGGDIKQRFVYGAGPLTGATYVRTGNGATWGAWAKDFNGFLRPEFGSSDLLESAGVVATLPNFKTPLGTAAAIAGQAAAATDPTIESAADVTSNITGPTEIAVECDSNGNPTSLPKTTAYKLLRNGSDITATATWTLSVISGTITQSFGAAGQHQITAMGSATAKVRLTATVGSRVRNYDVTVSKANAQAATGGSGSGGTSATTAVTLTTASTSMVVASGELIFNTGTVGTATLSGIVFFEAVPANPAGTFAAYWVWQRWNGSAWVDEGTETVSALDATVENEGGFYYVGGAGELRVSKTVTGLATSTQVKFRLRVRVATARNYNFFTTSNLGGTGT